MTADDAVHSLVHHYTAAAETYQRLWAGVLHPLGRALLDRLPLSGAPSATVVGTDRSPGMLGRVPAGFPPCAR